jgi:hypothetical protein
MLTTCKQNLGLAPWRQMFSRLNVCLLWCSSRYGTAMEQPWNIGVCWIDQVFVMELSVVIFFYSYNRFEYKNSILFGKNTYFIPYYAIDSVKCNFLSFKLLLFLGDWNIYPVFCKYMLTFMDEEPMKSCVTN